MRLDFSLYKVIVENLTLKGWDVTVYHIGDSIFGEPSTIIRVKQE